ncbi:hypothetical protein CIP107528_02145 [Corynebacterium diphtheriae]|nr:hypothetical protein CIP107528_02145 [Corynebacterium diphtheriae]
MVDHCAWGGIFRHPNTIASPPAASPHLGDHARCQRLCVIASNSHHAYGDLLGSLGGSPRPVDPLAAYAAGLEALPRGGVDKRRSVVRSRECHRHPGRQCSCRPLPSLLPTLAAPAAMAWPGDSSKPVVDRPAAGAGTLCATVYRLHRKRGGHHSLAQPA